MGYLKDTVKGITWVGAFRGVTRLVGFVKTAILARILIPAQFGLFGIAALALAFLEILVETGINVFLIQEKDNIDEYIDTAWVVSIIRGIVISFVIILTAKPVSIFFKSPDSMNLLYLIAVVPFVRGFINPSLVKLQKELQFKKEFWLKSSIFLFDAGVTVALALTIRSATSLVWGLIAGAVLEVLLSYIYVRPIPKLSFKKVKIKRIINRGKWVTGAGIFQYLFRQGDDAVVGKILGTSSLGLYQVAYKISSLPISEVADVIARVTFPVYTKISKDSKRFKNAFCKTILAVSVLVVPFGLVIFFFSREIILIILGDKWLEAVPVLRVLSIYGVIRAIINPSLTVFLAVKKQELVTLITFISVLGLAVSIVPLVIKFGIVGAGISTIIGSLISLPFVVYFSWKVLSDIK
ncbi:lipopolysaccharide biosynthesis protein [Patescibacteria group bacterium]|nr:lipopolysaccharide biosynthesis protein [Patescibacteria group bacterium]MBU0776987.1 lipopolysaccharide biosynthesis protein [Patescibacteria group bacterium]MBU0845593.1 lipopolysaccharide biosynthesis protein [Patescibacteria group bacterium]MBU0923016.1 lipopolysaccharide biosynthesis protein [Patescibacteria group bacterium]MBU1066328.1 lipopolysaccharide biosynthesis protein [Patescibacteria group bacterium]